MKTKLLKVAVSFAAIWVGAVLAFVVAREQNYKPVLATNFVAYDLARAVLGAEKVEMLIPAGTDLHHYEPTPADLKKIARAKLLIYNGGESEKWVEKLLTDFNGETLRMLDFVPNLITDDDANLEDKNENEKDDTLKTENEKKITIDTKANEHFWTSPKNVLPVLEAITKKLSDLFPQKQVEYEKNQENYAKKIKQLDEKLTNLVDNSKHKFLAFVNQFPFQYLLRDYQLKAVSALNSCSDEAEPSAHDITKLISEITAKNLPVVLSEKTEASDSIAGTIINETDAVLKKLHAFHFVSKDDFKSGKTYVDFFEDNLQTLEEALKTKASEL